MISVHASYFAVPPMLSASVPAWTKVLSLKPPIKYVSQPSFTNRRPLELNNTQCEHLHLPWMQSPWHLLKTVVCRPSKLLLRFAVGRSTRVTHVWESIAPIGEKMVNASGVICDSVADGLVCFLDMKKQFVYDPLIAKRQQYLLATQVSLSSTLN